MKLFKQVVRVFLLLTVATFTVAFISSFIIPGKPEPVKIGLLIPDNRSVAAVRGAELAVRKANREGGLNGRPFMLVVRSLEGPWGTGSKQAVNLVFDEKVWAILGSQDGRNAHLIEQVSAKTRVVFLSSWSGDPTLAQAFIPWFFNIVPDDRQQAAALFRDIFPTPDGERVAIASDNSYDSRSLEKYFLEEAKKAGNATPSRFSLIQPEGDLKRAADSIKTTGADHILILGGPSASGKLLRLLTEKGISVPVTGTLQLLSENEAADKNTLDYRNLKVVSPVNYDDAVYKAFRKEFSFIYSAEPGPVASYAYDGMTVLIGAIKKSGVPDYNMIRESLARTDYMGVTGRIRFDETGSRTGTCNIAKVMKGNIVTDNTSR